MMKLNKQIAVVTIVQLIAFLQGELLPSFHWDPRNPIFKNNFCGSANFAHIYVNSYAKLNFICPVASLPISIVPDVIPQDYLYENLVMVSRKEFDKCEVDSDRLKSRASRVVMNCNQPGKTTLKYYQFVFKPTSGSPTAFVFQSNMTYYFIATSSGLVSSLRNLKDGRCKSHNMRLAITVCEPYACTACPNLCCEKRTPPPTTVELRPTTIPATRQAMKTTTKKVRLLTKIQKPMRVPMDRSPPKPSEDTPVVLQKKPQVLHPPLKSVNMKSSKREAVKESNGLKSRLEKNPWSLFGLGVGCGAAVMLLVIFLLLKVRNKKRHKNSNGKEEEEDNGLPRRHYEMPSNDKLRMYSNECSQEPTVYTRLESTASTGSGGDSPPLYPDSPNGTLDSNGQIAHIVTQGRNGHVSNSRMTLLPKTRETCVQV